MQVVHGIAFERGQAPAHGCGGGLALAGQTDRIRDVERRAIHAARVAAARSHRATSLERFASRSRSAALRVRGAEPRERDRQVVVGADLLEDADGLAEGGDALVEAQDGRVEHTEVRERRAECAPAVEDMGLGRAGPKTFDRTIDAAHQRLDDREVVEGLELDLTVAGRAPDRLRALGALRRSLVVTLPPGRGRQQVVELAELLARQVGLERRLDQALREGPVLRRRQKLQQVALLEHARRGSLLLARRPHVCLVRCVELRRSALQQSCQLHQVAPRDPARLPAEPAAQGLAIHTDALGDPPVLQAGRLHVLGQGMDVQEDRLFSAHPDRLPGRVAQCPLSPCAGRESIPAAARSRSMSSPAETRERIGREALAALEKGGVEAARVVLEGAAPQDALAAYNGLARYVFRQRRDVDATIALFEAGVRFGEQQTEALRLADPQAASNLCWATKILAFNLASFLWPGWEDSPALSKDQVAAGRRGAESNLALTRAAERGPGTLGVAEWMLGAHLLAARELEDAIQHFEASAEWARKASDPAAERLARGFVAVTRLVGNPEDLEARAELERVRVELSSLKDGPAYASQFD